MHQLDRETKSFLHKALADVDAALKNYKEEDKKGATAKERAPSPRRKNYSASASAERSQRARNERNRRARPRPTPRGTRSANLVTSRKV